MLQAGGLSSRPLHRGPECPHDMPASFTLVVVQEQHCLTGLGSHAPSFVRRLWATKASLSSVRGNCMRALVPASTGTILEAGYPDI